MRRSIVAAAAGTFGTFALPLATTTLRARTVSSSPMVTTKPPRASSVTAVTLAWVLTGSAH